jgi:hypothetical protein
LGSLINGPKSQKAVNVLTAAKRCEAIVQTNDENSKSVDALLGLLPVIPVVVMFYILLSGLILGGQVQSEREYICFNSHPTAIRVTDHITYRPQMEFNGDAKLNIIWRNCSTGANTICYINGVLVKSQADLISASDLSCKIAGTGEIKNDGKCDILWRKFHTRANGVWYMDGISIIRPVNFQPMSNLNCQITPQT